MPHVGRLALKQQAYGMRQTGEQINLLISNEPNPNIITDTPFDPVAANAAVDDTAAIRIAIYALVRWHDLGIVKYEEGGRATFRKADIETTPEWMSYIVKAYGVELEDGSILRKCGEKLSETKSIYTMVVEGYADIAQ